MNSWNNWSVPSLKSTAISKNIHLKSWFTVSFPPPTGMFWHCFNLYYVDGETLKLVLATRQSQDQLESLLILIETRAPWLIPFLVLSFFWSCKVRQKNKGKLNDSLSSCLCNTYKFFDEVSSEIFVCSFILHFRYSSLLQ